MTIDARIDRLLAALESAGAHPVSDAEPDAESLTSLDEALAPLRLPEDLHRLYERLNPAALPLVTYPGLTDLEFALWGWRQHVEHEPGDPANPAGLFAFAYESWNHLLIELDGAGVEPGAVFEWGFGGDDFKLRCVSFGDWLDVTVKALEHGDFEVRKRDGRAVVVVDAERWRLMARDRLQEHLPHPLYGTETAFAEGEEDWPEHWHRSDALGRETPPPDATARTVAELLQACREGPSHATLEGRFMVLSLRAGQSTRIVLWDRSGKIDIECPSTISGAARLRMEGEAKVEVEAPRAGPPDGRLGIWATQVAEPNATGDVIDVTVPQAVALIVRVS